MDVAGKMDSFIVVRCRKVWWQ